MMIDPSPWPSCSRQSPWLPCSGHTIGSTGPSVSPFRDFFTASASTGLSYLFLKGLFSSQVGLGACEIVRSLPYYTSSCKTGPGKWTYFDDVVAQIVPVTDWLNRAMTNSMIDKQTLVPVSKIKKQIWQKLPSTRIPRRSMDQLCAGLGSEQPAAEMRIKIPAPAQCDFNRLKFSGDVDRMTRNI